MFMQIARDNQYIDTIFKNVKSAIFLYTKDLEILKKNDYADVILESAEIDFKNKVLIPACGFIGSEEKENEFQVEIFIKSELRTMIATVTTIYGHDGQPDNLVIVLDDITDLLNFQRVSIWKEIATRIAHEIKNPLTPIRLTAERVRKKANAGDLSEDLITNSMETIITEVEGLQSMVNEFNMFARLPEIKKIKFALCDFMSEVASVYELSNPNVKFDIDCQGVTMYGDRAQLKRVFINLVNNSIDAMEEGGVIKISAIEKDGRLRINYEDSGIGIAQEELGRIFIPYFSNKPDGTGLGLAIVKKIIEVHSGTITAESEYGKYTRFIMEFYKAA
jgi:two-component system nitrogen regulation sensor histidine kinase NtrY